ncbi:MAG: DUF167 domain-containing protein [Acidimicrobiia bacterium]|nr:DUF167 domain-containing protein [Actinomycetota bacterium]MBL6923940.1 DUF167 domain-containing protein [Acidimicrobiia bacterium]MBL6926075.1 DUF167 domain-containing protein [Acidimicrobiia bacterium]
MAATGALRIPVRVRPGARTVHVGGTWGPDSVLMVAVQAPAVDGRANKAVVEALANALGVSRRSVTLVGGERSRNKLVEIVSALPDVPARLDQLLGDPA